MISTNFIIYELISSLIKYNIVTLTLLLPLIFHSTSDSIHSSRLLDTSAYGLAQGSTREKEIGIDRNIASQWIISLRRNKTASRLGLPFADYLILPVHLAGPSLAEFEQMIQIVVLGK